MDTDVCTCSKEKGEHDATGINGACLNFTLDRKATWNADRDRARLGKIHARRERIQAALEGRPPRLS